MPLPLFSLLFYHADIKGAALTGKRMEVLKKLTEKKNREPVTVITTADAFLDGLPSKEKLRLAALCACTVAAAALSSCGAVDCRNAVQKCRLS